MKYTYLITLLADGDKIATDMRKLLTILKDKRIFEKPVEIRIHGCAIFIKTELKPIELQNKLNDLLGYEDVLCYVIEAYLNQHFAWGPKALWDWEKVYD